MDNKQAPSKEYSTREEKIKVIEFIKEMCEKGIHITTNYLYHRFGITGTIPRLLKLGVITPVLDEQGKQHGVYKWENDKDTVEDIVDTLWRKHKGSLPKEENIAPMQVVSVIAPPSDLLSDKVLSTIEFMNRYDVKDQKALLNDVIAGKVDIKYLP